MSDASPRSFRVADQIQKDLSVLIRAEVKDPRISKFVTIEEVRVTKDLSVAKIYISTLDDKGADSQMVLTQAAGFLRRELGKRIRMRSVPELRFVYDTLAEDAQHMSGLISKAVKADAAAQSDDAEADDESED
jgi:ribosome-binding factor A